jgi:hypothetical protein
VRPRPLPALTPLEPLEIAAGLVLEPTARPGLPPPEHEGRSARQALEHVVLSHLVNGRGSVSFSGGRDSSLVLAVACHVARREGLPDPVPVTMRHHSPLSDERSYQELVIDHLGIKDWVTVDVRNEMDILGPQATAVLEVTGVQAPPNAYLHVAVAEAAPRGTMMTGGGGDQYLGSTGGRVIRVLRRRLRPRPRDVLALGYALLPSRLRARRDARQPFPMAPWLTPSAERELVERRSTALARLPAIRWDTVARIFARSRNQRLSQANLETIGSLHGVPIMSPLADPVFVDAWAFEMGAAGPPSRTQAMYHLAGDLLPKELLERRTKAIFGAVLSGPCFREFVHRWSPSALAPEIAALLDADRLVSAWSEPTPPFSSLMLAEHSWLTMNRRSGQLLQ